MDNPFKKKPKPIWNPILGMDEDEEEEEIIKIFEEEQYKSKNPFNYLEEEGNFKKYSIDFRAWDITTAKPITLPLTIKEGLSIITGISKSIGKDAGALYDEANLTDDPKTSPIIVQSVTDKYGGFVFAYFIPFVKTFANVKTIGFGAKTVTHFPFAKYIKPPYSENLKFKDILKNALEKCFKDNTNKNPFYIEDTKLVRDLIIVKTDTIVDFFNNFRQISKDQFDEKLTVLDMSNNLNMFKIPDLQVLARAYFANEAIKVKSPAEFYTRFHTKILEESFKRVEGEKKRKVSEDHEFFTGNRITIDNATREERLGWQYPHLLHKKQKLFLWLDGVELTKVTKIKLTEYQEKFKSVGYAVLPVPKITEDVFLELEKEVEQEDEGEDDDDDDDFDLD